MTAALLQLAVLAILYALSCRLVVMIVREGGR